MEKLTVGEKAKRYDEAIEIAKDLHDNHALDQPFTYKTCEDIFPELKDSDDEGIRKEIVEIFRAAQRDGICEPIKKEQFEKIFAWLEKQGHDGKKWIYEDVYIKEKEQVFQDGIDEVLENPQRYGLEKQGEQNPSHNKKHIDYIKSIRKELLNIEDSVKNVKGLTESQWVAIRAAHRLLGEYLENQGEQKPTWSEEDEKILNEFIESLRYHNGKGYDKQINWLKSLKDRVQPQNTWRPSDKQMDALNLAIGEANSVDTAAGDETAEILTSLYEQLEELKQK